MLQEGQPPALARVVEVQAVGCRRRDQVDLRVPCQVQQLGVEVLRACSRAVRAAAARLRARAGPMQGCALGRAAAAEAESSLLQTPQVRPRPCAVSARIGRRKQHRGVAGAHALEGAVCIRLRCGSRLASRVASAPSARATTRKQLAYDPVATWLPLALKQASNLSKMQSFSYRSTSCGSGQAGASALRHFSRGTTGPCPGDERHESALNVASGHHSRALPRVPGILGDRGRRLGPAEQAHPATEVLVDGVAGEGRALHAEVPQLERHEVAREHVAPAPAELEVAHAAEQLAEEAARASRLLLVQGKAGLL